MAKRSVSPLVHIGQEEHRENKSPNEGMLLSENNDLLLSEKSALMDQ
jgi:hypothetical protein